MVSTTATIRLKIEAKKEKRRLQWTESKKSYYETKTRDVHDTVTSAALRQRKYRAKQNAKRVKQRAYLNKSRQGKKLTPTACSPNNSQPYVFLNRMAKSRSLKKMRDALPATPRKRTAVLSAYVHQSRATRSPAVKSFHENTCTTSNGSADSSFESDTLDTLKSFLYSVKRRRSDEARTTIRVIKSSVSGGNLEKRGAATQLAKSIGIKPAAIKDGKISRTKILHSQDWAFQYTKRKTRCDAISQDIKAQVFDFWLQAGNSRTANNKNDVKRVRIGPKIYSSHTTHVLEKTQTEVYQQFKQEYPDIKIGQRTFERCKPYFVRQASIKDKVTCCCRQHVEARSLFRTCSLYQKKLLAEQRAEHVDQFESLTDLCNASICPPSANTHQYKLSCLNRQCADCGVDKLSILPVTFDQGQDTVHWERYEYQQSKVKGETTVRKLVLVKKTTSPYEMFQYFLELLQTFPAHQFRAGWQTRQLKSLTETLPLGHCVAIHDFSENYRCCERNEIQSSYFQYLCM